MQDFDTFFARAVRCAIGELLSVGLYVTGGITIINNITFNMVNPKRLPTPTQTPDLRRVVGSLTAGKVRVRERERER